MPETYSIILKSANKKENFVLYSWAVLWFLVVMPNIVMEVVILVNDCGKCNPFDEDQPWTNTWNMVIDATRWIYRVIWIFVLIFLIFKIWISSTLLYKLKMNLNFYYVIKKKDIIFVTVWSSIAFIFWIVFTFFEELKHYSLNYRYVKKASMNTVELIFGTILLLWQVLLPILVMMVNVRSVNFKKYLFNIMKGYGNEQFFLCSSKFVYAKEQNLKLIGMSGENLIDSQFQGDNRLHTQFSKASSNTDIQRELTISVMTENDEDDLINLYQEEFQKLKLEDYKMSLLCSVATQPWNSVSS